MNSKPTTSQQEPADLRDLMTDITSIVRDTTGTWFSTDQEAKVIAALQEDAGMEADARSALEAAQKAKADLERMVGELEGLIAECK